MLTRRKHTTMKESPEGHGTLNWMVTWQSLHGGVCIEYFSTKHEAGRKVEYLTILGRTPLVWRRWT